MVLDRDYADGDLGRDDSDELDRAPSVLPGIILNDHDGQ
jgi:hypothetical protein